MMAMTTRSSTSVKPVLTPDFLIDEPNLRVEMRSISQSTPVDGCTNKDRSPAPTACKHWERGNGSQDSGLKRSGRRTYTGQSGFFLFEEKTRQTPEGYPCRQPGRGGRLRCRRDRFITNAEPASPPQVQRRPASAWHPKPERDV